MSSNPEFRHVLVIEDQKSRRIISLEESRYVLGRDPHSTILLYDRQCSRHHATLIRVNDYVNNHYSYRLIDGNLQGKKSNNGVIVNGRRTPSHELKHGDFIQFGSQTKASYQIIPVNTDLASLQIQSPPQFSPRRPELMPPPPEPVLPLPAELAPQDAAENTALFSAATPHPEIAQYSSSTSQAEYSPYPIFELDFSGQLTYLNPAARIAFPELSQATLDHPLLRGLIDQSHNRDDTSSTREVQVKQSYYEQNTHYFPEIAVIRCYVLDVSRYYRLERRYQLRKERAILFEQQGTEGLFVISAPHKQVIETNPFFCNLLGYRTQDLLSLELYNLLALGDRETVDRELAQVTTDCPLFIDESLYRRQDGTFIRLSVKISLAVYLNQEVYCFVVRAISDRKNNDDLTPASALSDPLTQLPNRTFFQQQLSLALNHAAQHQHLMSILFINLDSFKYINSTQGHAVGDQVLQQFGLRLKSLIKSRDVLARWGGDEYCLLLTQIKNSEEPASLAQAIFESLLQPFDIEPHRLHLKSSIGIALYPQDGADAETLLKNADTALHLTQQQGKNHYQYYHPRLNAEAFQLLNLETLLHQALEKKQFFLQYQPQVNLAEGRIVGLEALLGWQHPERGLIPSSKFLPLAAKTDLILPIGKWILQTACEQNLSWQREGLAPLTLSVNLSDREFQQLDLPEIVGRTLEKTALAPQWLELELTELTLRKHLSLARKSLADIQQLGVRIALDDYGTGFSSLGYLNQFSFNTIKINPSLLQNLKENSQESGIISAILAIAKNSSLRVVAEGVETDAQVEILRHLNCEIVQGNWVSQPLSTKEMTAFLANFRPKRIDNS